MIASTDLLTRSASFSVGYHELHPDASLNYQMNRFFGKANATATMIAEMREVAPRIHDYADFTREFLALSERAFARGETLNGAAYLRSAEFFMFADDPRKPAARRRFVQLMRQEFGVGPDQHHDIPYEGGTVSSYLFRATDPQGTIVLFGGFDSYIEEWLPIQLYLRDAGFDIVAFEGPGQGTTLEDSGIPMTHRWERPVKAVLDHFALDDVTLMGVSLGGCLAIRAAAYEPRVRRVIADDILTDFQEVVLGQGAPAIRAEMSALVGIGAAAVVNALVGRAMTKSLVAEWGIKQGLHVTGTASPYEFLRLIRSYRTDDVSPLVEQDVLLMAGAEDHYVPLHQFYDQIRSLTHVRSLTARLFTREEQAQNHCQIGNVGLSLRVIVDWIRLVSGSVAPSVAR